MCVWGGGRGEVTKVYEILQSVKTGRQERVCRRGCVCGRGGGGGMKLQRFMKFCSLLKEAGRRGVCVCGGGGEATKVYEILQSVKRGRQERVCEAGVKRPCGRLFVKF